GSSGPTQNENVIGLSPFKFFTGVTCVKPKGALYLFPKVDLKRFRFANDEQFVLDLLVNERVLLVPGTGFNYFKDDHFRIVFLPTVEELTLAMNRISRFLDASTIRAKSLEEPLLSPENN
ncbi:MAG: hypothetical protein LH606_07895, partial [Cytophagaceae bacterium]|nr:hypothetical protein [Cytophagaceae bacterium]